MKLGDIASKSLESLSSLNESITSEIRAFQDSMNKASKIIFALSDYFEYNLLVPPQVYDFLVKIKAPLSKEEIKELEKVQTEEDRKLYVIYTRKPKGKKIYNPKFYVNEETFKAIKILMDRNGSSVAVENQIVYFNAKTCALDIYGLVTYMKKDSDRYKLCKFFFANKRGPREWEVVDIVEALDEWTRAFDPEDKKKSYDWVNGKVTELNKDVKTSLGVEELVSYEGGRFVLNSANRL
jgi:succinate dehydrogenase flavin-adding protein (antitoxin of CptAB toxin-antitoxin module)